MRAISPVDASHPFQTVKERPAPSSAGTDAYSTHPPGDWQSPGGPRPSFSRKPVEADLQEPDVRPYAFWENQGHRLGLPGWTRLRPFFLRVQNPPSRFVHSRHLADFGMGSPMMSPLGIMEMTGFEPATSCLQSRRSPS